MANIPDIGGDAGSNIVQGAGTSTSTYVLPSNVGQTVESVVATIDNTAGAEQTVTLTVRDSSGEVIATRVQPDTIPAADTGTATWALRLDGDASGNVRMNRNNTGRWIELTLAGQIHPAIANSFIVDAVKAIVLQTATEFVAQSSNAALTLNGDATLEAYNGLVNIRATDDVLIQPNADCEVTPGADLRLMPSGDVITNLPNADPGVPGALWNNAGVVNVSP